MAPGYSQLPCAASTSASTCLHRLPQAKKNMKASALALFAGVVQSVNAAQLAAPELVAIATRHGMPQPPGGAPLVLAHTGTWSVLGNQSTSRDPGIYSPAFLLEDKTNSILVLRGTERQTLNAA